MNCEGNTYILVMFITEKLVMFNTIVQELKSLISSESILKESKKLDDLIAKFTQLRNDSGSEEDVTQLLANDLINELKNKISNEKNTLKKKSEAIKNQKEALVEKLEQLVKSEQNIGKAFNELKKIREVWNQLNEKSPLEQKEVDKKFTKQLEDFYYNINIYKAIQDHDLKRNKQLKEVILEKLKKAISTPTSKILMIEIKNLRIEWESVGPVARDYQDLFWEKYRALLDTLYSNFKDFKESEKETQITNLNKKLAIIEQIKDIDIKQINSIKDWKLKGQKIIEKQEDWKNIGYVPNESKDNLWQQYQSVCDIFFSAKKAFFDEQKQVYKSNKKQKSDLCQKAEELLLLDNPQELTKDFINIQSEWKKVGPVHQKDEQYLWFRFQKSCNQFFKSQKESKRQIEAEKDLINTKKETLIQELKKLTKISDESLKKILIDWWTTNSEHTRKSNQLEKEFNSVLESKFDSKSIKVFKSAHFNLKFEVYKDFDDNGAILQREKTSLIELISKLQKDIAQYENNLSFFGNSKGANSLIKDVYLKLDRLKAEIVSLKENLKLINSVLKD